LVVANMTGAPIALAGWTILAQAEKSLALPATSLLSGQPLSVALAADFIDDSGGVLTLVNPASLRVDGVAYLGGDPAAGWSTSF
jgi:hypothetical protein